MPERIRAAESWWNAMSESELLDFAAMLNLYRHRVHLSMRQLTAAAGNIPFYTIRNWARGYALPRPWRDVVTLAHALKLSAAEADQFLTAAGHSTLEQLSQLYPGEASLLDEWPQQPSAPGIVVTHQYLPPQPRPTPVHHQAPPLQRVVGREQELAALAQQLERSGTMAIVSAEPATTLFGVAGIGKSTLAALYYHRCKDRYGLVYWRSLSKDPLISGLVQDFAQTIARDFDPRSVTSEENQAMLLVGWLRELDETCLIVLDDCEAVLDEEGNAKPGWATLLAQPELGACRMLLTSRRHIRAARVRLHNYRISGMSEADGLKLLAEWGLGDTPPELLTEAVTKAGGHPLALILLAQLVVEDHLSLAELLADTRLWQSEVAQNLLDEVYRRLPPRQQQLIPHFSIYDQPNRFRYAASPEDVTGMLAELEPNLHAAGGETWDKATVAQVALDLSRRALLESDGAGYTMHTIVRDYAHARLSSALMSDCQRAAARYFQTRYTHAESNPPQQVGDALPLLRSFDHLCAAGEYQAAFNILMGSAIARMDNGHGLILQELLGRWGEYTRLIRLNEWLAEAPRETLDEGDYAGVRSCLASVYQGLGQAQQALGYFEEALEIVTRLGRKHDQSIVLANIGTAYADLGEQDKAIEYLVRGLEIADELGYQRYQSFCLGYLGASYLAIGELSEALACSEQAYALARAVGDRQRENAALSTIGEVYLERGREREAYRYLMRALEVAAQIGHARGLSRHWHNLARLCIRQERHVDALTCLFKARALRQQSADFRLPATEELIAEVSQMISLDGRPSQIASAEAKAAETDWRPLPAFPVV